MGKLEPQAFSFDDNVSHFTHNLAHFDFYLAATEKYTKDKIK